jgi:BirA family biotin operon repressor/biotin-[acetyl-CoA-carboxylase] ligase
MTFTPAAAAVTPGLSAARVAGLCGDAAREVAIRIVAETGSTNTDLLRALPTLETPVLLWAQTQTAGKGRAGRSWQSAADATLTFSLAWRFCLPMQKLAGLPLAVGVAVAEVLQSFGVAVQLKWPNDILREQRKLAGILIETARGENGDAIWAVIGIGINLAVPAQPEEDNGGGKAAEIAAGMAASDHAQFAHIAVAPELRADREQTMAALLTALAQAMNLFAQQGFAAFSARWNALHAHAGKRVNIIDDGKLLHQGTAIGVDDSGRLLLQTTAGSLAIVAGDVSLRAAQQ